MNKSRFMAIKAEHDLEIHKSRLVRHLVQDLGLMASCAAIWQWLGASPIAFLGFPIVSVLMFRNFSLMHDAVHGAVIRPRWLNEILGLWSGAACLLPFDLWKKVHLQHHHWAGNIDQDPVMMIVKTYPEWPKSLQRIATWLWNAWVPFMAMLQYLVFWYHSARVALKGGASPKVLMSVGLPITVWSLLLFLAPTGFILSNLIPGLLFYFMLVEVVNFPHHLEVPQHRGETKLPMWDQHQIARSCIYPRWFAETVVLNFNYHIEHHLYPTVPWYHLEKLHRSLRPEIGPTYNWDLNFTWILKNRPKTLAEVLRALAAENPEAGEAHSHDAA